MIGAPPGGAPPGGAPPGGVPPGEELLQEELLLEEGPYTSGRSVDLYSAGPLIVHRVPACVDADAFGSCPAAIKHIAVWITRDLV